MFTSGSGLGSGCFLCFFHLLVALFFKIGEVGPELDCAPLASPFVVIMSSGDFFLFSNLFMTALRKSAEAILLYVGDLDTDAIGQV